MFSGMHFSCLAQSLFFKVFDYKLRKKGSATLISLLLFVFLS